MNKAFKIEENLNGMRVDKAISTLLNDEFSRTYITNLFLKNKISINGQFLKPSYKVRIGDQVVVDIEEAKPLEIKKEDIELNIIYEDDDIIVINKEAGMVVHPSNGHYEGGTLVNALLHHCQDLSGINGVKRPGIVHRIDKDTSGLLVVAKNDYAHNFLASQLKDKTMHREYLALVNGVIKENEAKIIAPIGRDKNDRLKMAVDVVNGKDAMTHIFVMKRYSHYTLIRCLLSTGRTHQIRVHLNYIGYPIEGDKTYGKGNKTLYDKGQLLHAYKLVLIHPRTKEKMEFVCPIPPYFQSILDSLE